MAHAMFPTRTRGESPFRIPSIATSRDSSARPTSRVASSSNLAGVAKLNASADDVLALDTYAKFDEYEASFYGHLPPELNKLRNAGM